jgi:hypothetical protein
MQEDLSNIDIDSIDLFILEKIYNEKQVINLLNKYLVKTKNELIKDILINNIQNLLQEEYGSEKKDETINWLCNNPFNFWDELKINHTILFKIMFENNDYIILEKILRSENTRQVYNNILKQQNSQDYNIKADINNWINNKSQYEIEKIIKLLKQDINLYYNFIYYFKNLLKYNYGYSVFFKTTRVTHKFRPLYNIYRTLLNEVKNIDINNINSNKKLNLDELLYTTLITCYKILFSYPIDNNKTQTIPIFRNITDCYEDIMNDEQYFILNNKLINIYISRKDTFDIDILEEYVRIKNKYIIKLEDKNEIINNISIIINDYNLEKPFKYNILLNFINITENIGFGNNKLELLTILLNILTDIDFINFVKNSSKDIYEFYKFYKNLANCVNKLAIIIKDKYQDNNKLLHFMHNLCIKCLDVLDTTKRLLTIYNNLPNLSKSINFASYNLTMTYELTILISLIETILSIIKMLDNIDTIESVLIMPLSTLVNSSIDMFKDRTNVIYKTFNKQLEIKDILEYIYELIYLLKNNINFNEELMSKSEELHKYLDTGRVKISENKKKDLEIYFINLKNKNNLENIEEEIYKDCPEEFIDPLYFVVIKDPVMIPNTNDTIFDRNSIIGQIFHNGINPYTREKLTIQEFEEYNKRPEVINKIEEFKNKFNIWKENAIKNYKVS